jgi:hypothetical protein
MLNLALVFLDVFMTWAIISGNLYLYCPENVEVALVKSVAYVEWRQSFTCS